MRLPRLSILPAIFYLSLVSNVFGQRITGTILGTVTDPTGAIIPGVTITVTNVETNLRQNTVTNERGYYEIPYLPLGEYVVIAELSGFKRAEVRGVVLRVESQGRVDIKLEVGEVSEKVEVEAIAPLLNTQDATVGSVVEHHSIVELPLNERRFNLLATLAPGTSTTLGTGGHAGGAWANPMSTPFHAGGRNANNAFLVDGIETRGFQAGNVSVLPSVDAVREFKMIQSTYSAEYGVLGNAQINLTTQSGTNDFHGVLFEFIRNDELDARNFFDPGAPPEFKRNQFGGSLRGPVY
jgi:Carboxypeptidase regulatory-like domain